MSIWIMCVWYRKHKEVIHFARKVENRSVTLFKQFKTHGTVLNEAIDKYLVHPQGDNSSKTQAGYRCSPGSRQSNSLLDSMQVFQI